MTFEFGKVKYSNNTSFARKLSMSSNSSKVFKNNIRFKYGYTLLVPTKQRVLNKSSIEHTKTGQKVTNDTKSANILQNFCLFDC